MLAVLAACTRMTDAIVVNPCTLPVTVRLSSRPTPPIETWNAEVSVTAGGVARVRDAFIKGGAEPYTAEFGFGDETLIRQVESLPNDPVIVKLDAKDCPIDTDTK